MKIESGSREQGESGRTAPGAIACSGRILRTRSNYETNLRPRSNLLKRNRISTEKANPRTPPPDAGRRGMPLQFVCTTKTAIKEPSRAPAWAKTPSKAANRNAQGVAAAVPSITCNRLATTRELQPNCIRG